MSEPHDMVIVEQPDCAGSLNPDDHDWGGGHCISARFEPWERELGKEDTRDRFYISTCRDCGATKRETTGLF